jgi:hypothetical protein
MLQHFVARSEAFLGCSWKKLGYRFATTLAHMFGLPFSSHFLYNGNCLFFLSLVCAGRLTALSYQKYQSYGIRTSTEQL